MPVGISSALLAVSVVLGISAPASTDDEKSPALIRVADDAAAKSAFEAAKELGTVEAWDAFLSNYPTGFYADLARAYLKKAAGNGGATPQKDETRVAFSCNEGIPLIVTFVNEANDSYALYSHDSGPTIRLPSARSGSGFAYSDGYHELRGKGRDISLSEGGNLIDSCTED